MQSNHGFTAGESPAAGQILVRLEDPLSERARRKIVQFERMSGAMSWDSSNPASLVKMRRMIAVYDQFARYADPAWYQNLVRKTRLGGVNTITARPVRNQNGGARVLLYLHGGGFFFRARNAQAMLAARICRAAGLSKAYLPLYRLGPEHTAPAPGEDALSAYRALLEKGLDATDIVVAGDSAGGNLTLGLLMQLRDLGLPLPSCGVLLSPATDLSNTGASINENALHDPILGKPYSEKKTPDFYTGNLEHDDPLVSPLFGSFAGLPPLLAQVGSLEVLRDDSVRLLDKVAGAGGEIRVEIWNGTPHVWQMMHLPERDSAIASIGEFIGSVIG